MGCEFGGARRTLLGQLLHRAQGIEQEVRLDLGAQQAQLGFAQLARQALLFGVAPQLLGLDLVMAIAQHGNHDDRYCHQRGHDECHGHDDPGQFVDQDGPVAARLEHGGQSAEQPTHQAEADDRDQRLALGAHDLPVVEPDADQRHGHRDADRIGGDDRLPPWCRRQEGKIDQETEHRQHDAQLEHRQQGGRGADGTGKPVQGFALGGRHFRQLAGEKAAAAGRHLIHQRRVALYRELLRFHLTVPLFDAFPHAVLLCAR